jgi:hypothetical protein
MRPQQTDSEFKTSTVSKHVPFGPACVAVRRDNDCVRVTGTKPHNRDKQLIFSRDEWSAFIEGVKMNEFDA